MMIIMMLMLNDARLSTVLVLVLDVVSPADIPGCY